MVGCFKIVGGRNQPPFPWKSLILETRGEVEEETQKLKNDKTLSVGDLQSRIEFCVDGIVGLAAATVMTVTQIYFFEFLQGWWWSHDMYSMYVGDIWRSRGSLPADRHWRRSDGRMGYIHERMDQRIAISYSLLTDECPRGR